jgi:hypothetical protein
MSKYDARITITLPTWMLEDMRARARRQNTTVTEWIRQAVSAKRYAEDEAATDHAFDAAEQYLRRDLDERLGAARSARSATPTEEKDQ